MSDDEDRQPGLFETIGKALLTDKEARERFDRGMNAMTDADGAQVDLTALSGLLTGADRSGLIERFSQSRREAPGEALVEVREIAGGEGEIVGAHVFVSEPPAATDVYRGDDGLLVRTAQGDKAIDLPFNPGDIEWTDTENIAEFVVWRSEPVAGVLPEPDEETNGS